MFVDRKSWKYEQYSKRARLVLSGIPDDIVNEDLESVTCKIFNEVGVTVDRTFSY